MQPDTPKNISPTPQDGISTASDISPDVTNVTTDGKPTQKPSNNKQSEEKSKMSKKNIIGLVVLSLIAVGGVLFGIYGMNSQNDQIAQLTARATDAENKVATLETNKVTITEPNKDTTEITDTTDVTDVTAVSSFQNPVIENSGGSSYDVMHSVPVYIQNNDTNTSIYFYTKNGQFGNCYIANTMDNCSVNGLPEGIYKMATIFEGNGMGDEKIGFLMTDGSVYFAPIYEGADSGNLNVNMNLTAKKANIDGFVKDIVSINYCSETDHYCYASTVFVMSDNSLIKYDKSMF